MPPSPQDLQRRKVRVSGKESVVDVAVVVFQDPRLAPLIADLNPSLPGSGVLEVGLVVMCPSKIEAAAFAKKMGFTLGFDEKASNGTKQKRAWQKMQGPGQASHSGIDPAEAARTLLDQKIAAAEVGKRLVKLAAPEALQRFLAQPQTELPMLTVQKTVELYLAFPVARVQLQSIVGVIDASLRPAALLSLLQAMVANQAAASAVLNAVVAPAAACQTLLVRAPVVVRLVERALELSRIERGARDATLAVDDEAAVLSSLCSAVADHVEPVSGERLKALGLDEAHALLSAHLLRLKEMFKKHEELLPRAGIEVIRALARGEDGSRLPKPWPLIAAVVRGLSPLLAAAAIEARDHGLGGLVPRLSSAAPSLVASLATSSAASSAASSLAAVRPLMSAASLQARAASGARAVDEGTAIAERLAAGVVALFDLVRPLSGDAGPAPLRRARRRGCYDDAVLGKSAPQGEAIAKLIDELFADARRTGLVGVDRVQKAQEAAARQIGKGMTGVFTVNQKPGSELGRAIVVCAMTIDRDLGGLLLRTTGKEAFKAAVEKHGGKLLSKAALLYSEPPPVK